MHVHNTLRTKALYAAPLHFLLLLPISIWSFLKMVRCFACWHRVSQFYGVGRSRLVGQQKGYRRRNGHLDYWMRTRSLELKLCFSLSPFCSVFLHLLYAWTRAMPWDVPRFILCSSRDFMDFYNGYFFVHNVQMAMSLIS